MVDFKTSRDQTTKFLIGKAMRQNIFLAIPKSPVAFDILSSNPQPAPRVRFWLDVFPEAFNCCHVPSGRGVQSTSAQVLVKKPLEPHEQRRVPALIYRCRNGDYCRETETIFF